VLWGEGGGRVIDTKPEILNKANSALWGEGEGRVIVTMIHSQPSSFLALWLGCAIEKSGANDHSLGNLAASDAR
jgi:hypothetical protein